MDYVGSHLTHEFIVTTNPRTGTPSLNFALLISRYIRQFQRSDPREALQYIYCLTLNTDKNIALATSEHSTVSQEQLSMAQQMVRNLILGSEGKWDEIIGAYRDDGTKYVSHSIKFRS